MKTKKVILIAVAVLVSFYTLAQETQPPYQKDIGFNTTFLLQGIFNSGETPFSLMYKKYTSENKANRFGLDLSLNLDHVSNIHGNQNYTQYSSAAIHLSLGREIQKPINQKWTWFYGGDVIPFYQFSDRDDYQNNDLSYSSKFAGYGVSLRPFLAIRYNIHPRLYLSAEASLNLRYRHSTQSSEFYPSDSLDERQSNNISFGASPASGLFLYYRF